MKAGGAEVFLSTYDDGAVSLYYDHAVKLTTASTGVTITGALKTTTILDTNNSAGTSNQVLTSTGSALDWKTLGEISGVDGSGTANYLSKWTDTDTIGNSNILDNGTNVGISTNNPVGLLDLIRVSNTAPALRIGSSATYGWGFFSRASTGDLSIERDNNTTYSPTLYLKRADGNVGIGTTAPAQKLHVEGNIRLSINSFLYWGATGTRIVGNADYMRFNTGSVDALSIDSSQRVGIGTTAPSVKLTLDGTYSSTRVVGG